MPEESEELLELELPIDCVRLHSGSSVDSQLDLIQLYFGPESHSILPAERLGGNRQ